MRELKLIRYEGKYVICEDSNHKLFAIESAELPKGIKIGTKVEIDDEGVVTVKAEPKR